MNSLKFLLITFIILCSTLAAENLPKYRMVDLGLFEMDHSYPIAINEKNQVLGICYQGQTEYIFLWEENKGLKFIDCPSGTYSWTLRLNNRGQIAGYSYKDSMSKIFFWDPNLGFWDLEATTNSLSLTAFNDLGQVLGYEQNQMFIWERGRKTNLTALFLAALPGNWSSFQPISLNNHGSVVFNTYRQQETGKDTWGHRSFLWVNGEFKIILPEKGWQTSTSAACLDDDGNMIIHTYLRQGGGNSQFFISQAYGSFVDCQGCDILRNGLPQAMNSLPGKLKKDRQGNMYFSKGLEIKKLLQETPPYYNIANTIEIRGQNSHGYVVGTIDTMYSGYHAFLAIPE